MRFTSSSKTLFGIKFVLYVICTAASVKAATILKKRISVVVAAAGAVLFFGASYGAKKIANVACTPEAQAALSQVQWTDNAAGCLGWSAGAIILAAAGAAFAVAGGAGNWNWVWENAGAAATISSRGLSTIGYANTSSGNIVTTDNYLLDIFPSENSVVKRSDDWYYLHSYYLTPYNTSLFNSSAAAVNYTANSHNPKVIYAYAHSNGSILITMTDRDHVKPQHEVFLSWLDNSTSLITRDDPGNWISYNTYGANPGRCDDLEQHLNTYSSQYDGAYEEIGNTILDMSGGSIPSKFCAAASDGDENPGENSAIVGEIYFNQYGGIDSDCDSL